MTSLPLSGTRRGILFATTAADAIENFVGPVAEKLADRGHSIHVITGDREARVGFPHTATVIPTHRSISALDDVRSLTAWVRHLRRIRPRAVVIGTPKASLLGLTAARTTGVPTRVYVIHGAVWDGAQGPRRRILEAAEKATLAASTHHVAVSNSLARLIKGRGLSRDLPRVLGSGSFCGVDTDHFTPGAGASSLSMVYVGRLNRDKGIDVLVRTVDRVRAHIDARLTVVGGLDETNPPPPRTMDLLVDHPHIDWVGESEDVVTHLQQASVLLLPTAREGLPQAALEAQACGVPVVSWQVTGVVDAVRDGFTGTLVEFGDEQSLAAAAIDLLTDDQRRRTMSENARRFATSHFDQQATATANADYLESAIGGR
jgi:glycosyltransferase involved in cell wall biosynthesis